MNKYAWVIIRYRQSTLAEEVKGVCLGSVDEALEASRRAKLRDAGEFYTACELKYDDYEDKFGWMVKEVEICK